MLASLAKTGGVRQALMLVILLAVMLGGFVFVIGLITVLRRRTRRDSRRSDEPTETSPDPWKESAKRIDI